MATNPYGLNAAQMSQIITATENAISQMSTVNGQVLGLSTDIHNHAVSDAGRIMQTRLDSWTRDFGPIVDALQQLNTNAQSVLQKSIQTGSDASGAAGH